MRPETRDERPETPDPERMLKTARGMVVKQRRMAMGGVRYTHSFLELQTMGLTGKVARAENAEGAEGKLTADGADGADKEK